MDLLGTSALKDYLKGTSLRYPSTKRLLKVGVLRKVCDVDLGCMCVLSYKDRKCMLSSALILLTNLSLQIRNRSIDK